MIDGIRPPRRPAHSTRPSDKDYLDKFAGRTHSSLPGAQPFRTPQAVAAAEATPPPSSHHAGMPASAGYNDAESPGNIPLPPATAQKESFIQKMRNLDKKQWAIIIAVLTLLIGGGIAAFYMLKKDAPVVPAKIPVLQKQAVPEPEPPTTVASKMTGLQVDLAVNDRPVTGIMIENSADSRPQSGLQEADVIFEAIAEGGITRFLTLYHDKTTPYIGPVRSVRPYYIQWALGFDAAIAHAGGSADALKAMKSWNVKDLDQFANGGSFQRVSNRYAPHNLYTSIASMNALESKKGFGKSSFTSLERKAEEPAKTPEATSIDVAIGSSFFNSHYDYDAGSNAYKRSQAGAPHTVVDQSGTATQLQPKVVIALVMVQGKNDIYTTYGTIGSGKAFIFQDGKVTEGTWKKNSNTEQFTFTNLSNQPVKLNPGQTWLTAVGNASYVTYRQ